MTASTFTKFDPRTFLEKASRAMPAANPAKDAKVGERGPGRTASLATLAALAGGQAETDYRTPSFNTWADAHEEHAAIFGHEDKALRAWSEGFARLDPNKPPADMPPRRWLGFSTTAAVFFVDAGPRVPIRQL
jgi:hypothetical protein